MTTMRVFTTISVILPILATCVVVGMYAGKLSEAQKNTATDVAAMQLDMADIKVTLHDYIDSQSGEQTASYRTTKD